MLIIIPNGVHVHTLSDPGSDYLRLHDVFPALQKMIIYRQTGNIGLKHMMNVH